jgi:phosphatidylserine decarboxylase
MTSAIKIAREGWPFIAVPGAIALALLLRGRKWSAAPFALASLASAGFFRDPDRTPPDVEGAVLSAADGYVVGLTQAEDPFVGEAIRVSVFLSPLDVHVNRSPITGAVVDRQYTPGSFGAAYRPDALGSPSRRSRGSSPGGSSAACGPATGWRPDSGTG